MRLPFLKAPFAVFLNERQVEKSGGVNKKNRILRDHRRVQEGEKLGERWCY